VFSTERIHSAARVGVAGALALTVGLVIAPSATADEVYPRPAGTTIEFLGHGWGHGIGMSQYGSLGGAQAGATYQEILAHYYTGVTLGDIGSPTIKVRVASLGSSVQALPAAGLRVTWDLTNSSVLPTSRNGVTIVRWRIVPSTMVAGTKTKFRLQYLPAGSSTWQAYATASVPTTGAFLNPTSGMVTTLRGSTQVVYRGQVRGVLVGSAGAESLVPVVALPLESYLLSVVPSESPASWPAAALRAQAVAARSFAEYHRRYAPASSFYDVYDDTRSQVFSGTKVGAVNHEYATSTAAVEDTAHKAMFYSGSVVFAQFSSSSGGYTNTGSKPYLKAVPDPWDAVSGNPNNTWQKSVAISTIEKAYPTVGRLSALRITSRTGLGDEGGRVLGMTIEGLSGSVTTTGSSFASKVGLKHHWFTPQLPGSSPSYPRDVTADGRADLLAVEASGGALRVYPSAASGGWGTPVRSGSGWNGFVKVLTAGTWNADPISDIIVQDSAGRLYLRAGTGRATFGTSVQIGSGWGVTDEVFPVGDFDGDGLTDIMARKTDGTLWVFRGDGQGRFLSGAGRQVGSGWGAMTALLSPGDFDGDGISDVLARDAGGTVYLYRGDGVGGWILPRTTVAVGWQQYTALSSMGDVNSDGRSDVIGRTANGDLWLIPGDGSGGVKDRSKIGAGWNIFSRVLR
jgi:SpoIID/LytB domain protein